MRDKRLIAVEYRRVKKIRDREIIGKKIELELHTECHSRETSANCRLNTRTNVWPREMILEGISWLLRDVP